jgi:hypothetical protein
MQILTNFMVQALAKAASLGQSRFEVRTAGYYCVLNLAADDESTIDFIDASHRRIDIFILPGHESGLQLYLASDVDGTPLYDFSNTSQIEPGLRKIVEDGLIILFDWFHQV